MTEIKCNHRECIAILSGLEDSWHMELAQEQWGDYPPKLYIRKVGPDGRMGKGISLTEEEIEKLINAYEDLL